MKKILAVDDEQDIRTLLKESLELEGYLVYTAKNGMEANSVFVSPASSPFTNT